MSNPEEPVPDVQAQPEDLDPDDLVGDYVDDPMLAEEDKEVS